MAAWPRAILPQRVGKLRMPSALESWSQSGKAQHRTTVMRGRVWAEVLQPFEVNTDAGQQLLATIDQYRLSGDSFTIDHRFHLTHRGSGTGTALVNGAGQTGSTLNTDGWTGSNPVLKHGDLISIAGLSHVFNLKANAPNLAATASALSIDPPILVGGSPADNAVITYTGVLLNAFLLSSSEIPDAGENGFIAGVTLNFRESV